MSKKRIDRLDQQLRVYEFTYFDHLGSTTGLGLMLRYYRDELERARIAKKVRQRTTFLNHVQQGVGYLTALAKNDVVDHIGALNGLANYMMLVPNYMLVHVDES